MAFTPEPFANSATPSDPEAGWPALASGVNASATTFTLSAAWPNHGRFSLDDEYGRVTAGFGTTSIAVVRAIEGSTAASHASGAKLKPVLTKGGLANFPGPLSAPGQTISIDADGNVVALDNVLTQALGDARYALSSALSGYQPIDADLTAIAALSTNGFAKRTGAGTWAIDSSTYLTGVAWGGITGTLSAQADLQTALDGKLSATLPGSDTQILFNDGGALSGSSDLTWDGAVLRNKQRVQIGPDQADLDPFVQGFTGAENVISSTGFAAVGIEASASAVSTFYLAAIATGTDSNARAFGFSSAVYTRGEGAPAYAFYGYPGAVGPVTAGELFGVWIGPAALEAGAGAFASYAFYMADSQAPSLKPAHAYAFWADEQGVFRIKADNPYDGVYQAIPALYNPQFTKYVAGAVDHERIVQQWNGNIAEIGAQKGGTGTLRALRLIGSSVSAVGNLTAANLSGTNTGDQDLSAYALTANVVPNTRTVNGSALSSNVTISTITGNAGTATTLQTARNINGTSFNGSADITITAAPTAHNLLSASHGDTLAASVVRGDILYGNSTPAWARLAKPSVLSGLSHDGTDVSWVTATGTGAPVRAAGPSLSGAVSIAGGTVTDPATPLAITQTWNDAADTFNAVDVSITNTNSAAASRLFRYSVGGASQLSLTKDGKLYGGNESWYVGFGSGASYPVFVVGGAARLSVASSQVILHVNELSWDGNVSLINGVNVLMQRNGANAQEFQVYGSTTGSKYLSLKHDGTNPIIGSSSGALKVNSTAVTPASTGTRYLVIDTNGVISSSATAPSGT